MTTAFLRALADQLLALGERLHRIPVMHGVDGADVALCDEAVGVLRALGTPVERRRCEDCGCLLAHRLGDLEKHVGDCKNFPL